MTVVHGTKPRLLVLASTYPRWKGDAEPGFVHELSRRLASSFDVTVITPHAAGASTSETLDGVEVRRYRYAPEGLERLVHGGGIGSNLRRSPMLWLLLPLFTVSQLLATFRMLRSEAVDVVHVHWLIPQGLVLALLARVLRRIPPVLMTSHGGDLFMFQGGVGRRAKRAALRVASSVSVVGTAMRTHVARLDYSGPIDVMPMGVDLEMRFTPDRHVLRSSSEVLFVGRLVEKKGLVHLIHAMQHVVRSHPAAHLTVVGTGPEERTCRDSVAALGLQSVVTFVGPVSQLDLPSYYRRAAVFVAPFVRAATGDQEGLGLVAVEAVGCECPTVVGEVEASHDLEQFAAGQLTRVDARDPIALGEAILAVIADPESARVRAMSARASMCARLDWSAVARGYATLLHRCIGARK